MLIIGLGALGFSAAVILANLRRQSFRLSDELTKNCLLTRHPILFLSGRRTIFYFLNYWNWIPFCLSDHGFEVYMLNLPWRNRQDRLRHLKDFFHMAESKSLCFHVIGDSSCREELQWMAIVGPEPAASLNLICSKNSQDRTINKRLSREDLRPTKLAIETIDLPPIKSQKGLNPWLWKSLAILHNLVLLPDKGLDPVLTGAPGVAEPGELRQVFLDMAVSLAERDLRTHRPGEQP